MTELDPFKRFHLDNYEKHETIDDDRIYLDN